MDYFEYIKENGVPKWPYPIEYGQETRDSADVLVIGGGLSGCFAAMHAARRGCSVIILEKGATIRSGSGGGGTDHWMYVATNPDTELTVDEVFNTFFSGDRYSAGHLDYIVCNEAYPALLDLEEIGVKIRDTDHEFDGAPFKSEKSGLLYAYDYQSKYCIRAFTHDQKIRLYEELKRLGVKIYDRVMGTSLLNENGEQGRRVIGATGYNMRTGRFYVISAKATILATAKPLRLWQLSTEVVGSSATHDDPNGAGCGDVMAYKAGAKLINMERSEVTGGGMRLNPYTCGAPVSTWWPVSMVDAENKEIPWVNRNGEDVDAEHRSLPVEGQKLFVPHTRKSPLEIRGPYYTYDLYERILSGEFKQPFFADLSTMSDADRRGIFGLKIGNASKTQIPVFGKLTQSGFDPEKDMLQQVILPPKEAAEINCGYAATYEGSNSVNVRDLPQFNAGGVMVDWSLQSSLEGLYAVGNNAWGIEGASTAASTGRYCGRVVARAVKTLDLTEPSEEQISAEKSRVYAPLKNGAGYGWKEVQIGLNRVMQDYVGKYKSKEILETGLWYLSSIENNEYAGIHVSNPHELGRCLETGVRLEADRIIMLASLARDTSNPAIDFYRVDCPEVPQEQEYMLSIRDEGGAVRSEKEDMQYWLKGRYSSDYEENYRKYNCLEG